MNLNEVFPLPPTGEAPLLCRVFGVRHLSPAGAFHLQAVLDELKPTAVLVEGPADATPQLPAPDPQGHPAAPGRPGLHHAAARRAPILYPLASYSPEWVALTWGLRNKAETRFIDLPASVFLELHHVAPAEDQAVDQEQEEDQAPGQAGRLRPRQTRPTAAWPASIPWPTSTIPGPPSPSFPAIPITKPGGNATSSIPPNRAATSTRSTSSAGGCGAAAAEARRREPDPRGPHAPLYPRSDRQGTQAGEGAGRLRGLPLHGPAARTCRR